MTEQHSFQRMIRQVLAGKPEVKRDPPIDLNKGLTYAQQAEIQVKIIDEKVHGEKKDGKKKPPERTEKEEKKSVKKDEKVVKKEGLKAPKKDTQNGNDKKDVKSKDDGKKPFGKGKIDQENPFKSKGKENEVVSDDESSDGKKNDAFKDKGTSGKDKGVDQKPTPPTGDSDSRIAPIKISKDFDPDDPDKVKIGKGNPVDLSPTLQHHGNKVGDGMSKPAVKEERINELSSIIKNRYRVAARTDVKKRAATAITHTHKANQELDSGNYEKSAKAHKTARLNLTKAAQRQTILHRMKEQIDPAAMFVKRLRRWEAEWTPDPDFPITEELVNEAMGAKVDGLKKAKEHNKIVAQMKKIGELKKGMMHQKLRDKALTQYFKSADVKDLAKFANIKCESEICLNDYPFQLEWAVLPEHREQGLMYRDQMDLDRGMIFEFDQESRSPMWMKNTYLPLDMIFVNEEGIIVYTAQNCQPESLKYIIPECSYKYCIEVNSGLVDQCGILVGQEISELKKPKGKLPKYGSPTVPAENTEVSENRDIHLANLKNAGNDEEKFNHAHGQLSQDKHMKNADLEHVAKNYDVGVALHKNREGHLKQIRQAFVRRARFDNKIKEERVNELSDNKVKAAVYKADAKAIEANLRKDPQNELKKRAQGDRLHSKLMKRMTESFKKKVKSSESL